MLARAMFLGVALTALAAMSCNSKCLHVSSKDLKAKSPTHLEAIALWQKQERVILAALRKEALDDRSFTEAIGFFEHTTGIISDTGTFLGRMPTPRLEKTFQEWQDWYRRNADNLVMDGSGSCMVVVRR